MPELETHTYDWDSAFVRVSRDPHAHTRIKTDSHTATPAVEVELEFSSCDTQQTITIWAEQPLGRGLTYLEVPAHWLPPLLAQIRNCLPAIDADDDNWRDAIRGIHADMDEC